MKILLTGGHGMVGRNVQEHPNIKNHSIYSPTRAELNLSDWNATRSAIEKAKPDLIIHAAGRVGGIQANIKNPVAFLVENVEINKNVIMAAREAGVKKFLNLGSSCMYPRNATNPLKEEMVLTGDLEPTNEGYALAKCIALRLCEYIGKEDTRFQYKTIIPCNLYGRFDKFDPEHSHLVPAIIYKLHKAKTSGATTVDIWGDGLARREFMYAGDLADFITTAVTNFEKLPVLMNVGLGHDYSINEYYKIAAEVIGYKGQFVHDPSKPVGMKQKLVSIERLKNYGWQPKTSLAEGLAKTYDFFIKNVGK